jgi:hypothetical protein
MMGPQGNRKQSFSCFWLLRQMFLNGELEFTLEQLASVASTERVKQAQTASRPLFIK